MKDLTPPEKRTIREIEEIRHIIYGHKNEDPDWIKDVRPHKLKIERDELIRNFVISYHCLTEEFLRTELLKYFINYGKRSKKYKFFEEFILEKLSYREKLDLAYQLNLIPKKVYKFLGVLNTLRNKCAHRWFLKNGKIRLLYKGKSILKIDNFREFADDVFKMLYAIHGIEEE
jgi:hypothetical protein